ncbi:MAG: hypothetical protein AAF721_31175 [Myxococcota bacterium]
MSASHPPVYPHGVLREVLPDVFVVNGSIALGAMQISRAMVVVRDGERLVVVNSLRMNEEGLAQLDGLGTVTDIIRLGGFHGSDDPFYKERYAAKSWAIAGQTYFKGTNPDVGEVYFEADGYLGAGDELPLRGASVYVFSTRFPEAILRLPVGGGTLVAADAMHNWHADELFNEAGKTAMTRAGMLRPYRLGGGWLRSLEPAPEEVAGILELEFDNVLPGHGQPVIGGAKDKYRAHIDEYVVARSAT